jgi:quercetin dioxygenase-like cupin family protein
MEPEPTIATQAQKVVWEDRDFTEVRPGIFGATVHTPQLTATLYRYRAGTSWEEHQHPQDQVTTVLEGSIEFVIAGEPVRLARGQTATLPGGTSHSASVPGTEPCVTINVLTSRPEPPRAD